MVIQAPPMTAKEFEEFALMPQNRDRRLEFMAGEVVELVSNQKSSRLGGRMLHLISIYLDTNPIGFVTSADGGYQVGDDRYIPDVGYVSKARQPAASDEAYNVLPPDLAVEVVSPSDEMREVLTKVTNYLLVGTVVWVVYPNKSEIGVFIPGQPARTLGINDSLDGGEVLPGFSVPIKDIFGG